MKLQLNVIRGRGISSRVRSLRRILFACLLLVFMLLMMWFGYVYRDNYYEIKDNEVSLALISEKINTLNEEAFRIVEYKREWDFLHRRVSLSRALRGSQIWWTPKLQGLSELMPENIWMESLSLKRSPPPPKPAPSSEVEASPTEVRSSMTLLLQGFALPGDDRGLRSIENFAQQLKGHPAFGELIREINLTTARRTEKEEVSVMSFRLSLGLVAEKRL
ncbi:hypothetical protein KAS10_03460 [Candidatus Aerophobetes bacterium]|nr:hypothetical protein [Candidatus Aerophobetes bacterium]